MFPIGFIWKKKYFSKKKKIKIIILFRYFMNFLNSFNIRKFIKHIIEKQQFDKQTFDANILKREHYYYNLRLLHIVVAVSLLITVLSFYWISFVISLCIHCNLFLINLGIHKTVLSFLSRKLTQIVIFNLIFAYFKNFTHF